MPIYDYRCVTCSHRFEVIHGVHVDGPTACPACGEGPVIKAVSAPAVHFKGSGWAKMERRSAAGSRTASGAASPPGAADDGTGGSPKVGDADGFSQPTKEEGGAAKRDPADAKAETTSTKREGSPRSSEPTPSSAGSSGGD